jgi:polyferredoxin
MTDPARRCGHTPPDAPRLRRLLVAGALLLLGLTLLAGRVAAEPGMTANKLPLWKLLDQPFFSLDGTHVELFSLLVLFLATVVVMTVRRRRQLIRHLVQIASMLIFFYVVFSCLGVFGMIRNTLHGVSLIGTVYTESFFWMSLPVCVLAFSLTAGPFFCGWICPTGSIQEFFTMAREVVLRTRRELRPTPFSLALVALFFAAFLYVVFSIGDNRKLFVEDSSLYWAAATIVVTFLVLARVADDRPTRALRWVSFASILASAIFKTIITSPMHFAFVDVFDPASAITTAVLSVAALFIGRSWCRYLCPWGLLMSLLHRTSRLRVRVVGECSACGTCVTACRVGAVEIGKIHTEHCQFCFACVDACPHGGIAVVDEWQLIDRLKAGRGEARSEQRTP